MKVVKKGKNEPSKNFGWQKVWMGKCVDTHFVRTSYIISIWNPKLNVSIVKLQYDVCIFRSMMHSLLQIEGFKMDH